MSTRDPHALELELMRLMSEGPALSQRQMASELSVSLGAINYCVQALIDKGWVKIGNFKDSPHKWKYRYLLTPKGISERMSLTRHFLARKLAEYDRLQGEIQRLERELGEGN